MTEMYSVDRIEGAIAILESDGVIREVALCELPMLCEGDRLRWSEGVWRVDTEETACERARLQARRRALLERGGKA